MNQLLIRDPVSENERFVSRHTKLNQMNETDSNAALLLYLIYQFYFAKKGIMIDAR